MIFWDGVPLVCSAFFQAVRIAVCCVECLVRRVHIWRSIHKRCHVDFGVRTANERDAAIMRVVVGEDTRMVSLKLPLIETLRNTPLFSGLTESELQALANRTTVRSCGVGEVLFSEE